eukprot:UN09911
MKQLSLYRAPKMLIIQLHRIAWTHSRHSKLNNGVKYPLADLELKKFVSNSKIEDTGYDLYAVIIHKGSLNSGHYYCHVKSLVNGLWYKVDGGEITKLTDEKKVQT